MSDETDPDWMNELFDDIEEMLGDIKRVKFNTHKNRKVFFGELKSLVIDAIKENTLPKPSKNSTGAIITRPNKDKSKGFAVMTESGSAQGDDIKPPSIEKWAEMQNKRAGMRHW